MLAPDSSSDFASLIVLTCVSKDREKSMSLTIAVTGLTLLLSSAPTAMMG
jgi:hypothetical protein